VRTVCIAMALIVTLLTGCHSVTAPSGSTLVSFVGAGQNAPYFPFLYEGRPFETNASGYAVLTGTCRQHGVITPSARYTGWSFPAQEVDMCDPTTTILITLIDIPARPHQ